jgi:hypothetical protein
VRRHYRQWRSYCDQQCCGRLQKQGVNGGKCAKKKVLRMKKLVFCTQQILKLLLQIEANSITYCDFSKFIISVQAVVFISRLGCPKA